MIIHRSFFVFHGQISFFMIIDVTTLCHVQSNVITQKWFMYFVLYITTDGASLS